MQPIPVAESVFQNATRTTSSTRTVVGTVAGIILAGSYRSRERDFSDLIPRPLLPVAQIPIVAYIMRWLDESGVRAIKLCSNGHARLINACLAQESPITAAIEYVEDPTPRGPAGCARDAALGSPAELFVVVDGSVIPSLDFNQLIEAHVRSHAALTVVVEEHSTPHASRSLLAPAGIYVFSRRALDGVSSTGFQDIKEHVIPALRRRRESVRAFVASETSPRVTTAETYLAVNHWAIACLAHNPAMLAGGNITVRGEVVSHVGATVHPRARLIGPVVLGKDVTIAADTTIVGPTSIGSGTEIERHAVISRSVLWNDCRVRQGCFVDHAVLSTGVALAARSSIHRTIERRAEAPRRFNWKELLKTRVVSAPRPMADPAIP